MLKEAEPYALAGPQTMTMETSMNVQLDLRRTISILALFVLAIAFLIGCRTTAAPKEDVTEVAVEETVSEEIAEDADLPDGHLSVRTLFAEDGPEAERGMYRVSTPDGEGVSGPTRGSSFDLKPGTYEVSVSVGNADAQGSVDVRSEERTELELILNAGVLQISSYLIEGGAEAPNPLYRILSTETDIQGDRETIVSPTRSSSFTLPEGSYIARVSDGQASVDKEITIEAGQRHEVDVILNAGFVDGKAIEEDGSEVGNPLWRVLAGEEDISGDRATVASPTRSNRFLLPAGNYLLYVTEGGRTATKDITVTAGERLEVEITLPAAE